MDIQTLTAALPALKAKFPGRTVEEWLTLAQTSPDMVAAEIARATEGDATTLAALIGTRQVSARRIESLVAAIAAGADLETLSTIRDAVRCKRDGETIVLPAHRYEGLSRGRGWCGRGRRGPYTEWGTREAEGYRVGPGTWTVGGHDGFTRKGQDTWTVRHVRVGDQTWTVAS